MNRYKNDNQMKNDLAKKIVDKSTPIKNTYDKAENIMVKAFKFLSDWFDRVLFNQRFGKLIACALAFVLVFSITTQDDKNIFNDGLESAIKIKNIDVKSNISSSVYDITGLPKKVDVIVTGDTSDVQSVSTNKSELQVLADLASFDEGTHEVKLTPVNFSSKVDVTVEPSSAIVTIKKKVSKSFKLGYDFVNDNKFDQHYTLNTPIFSQNDVIVRASEDKINQIGFVKALIDVNGVKEDFTQDVSIVAYNQKGEIMNVDIIPKTVNVKVKVSSLKKKVPIHINPIGDMKKGLAIDSYHIDHKEIEIYGPQEYLDKVKDIKVNVPVNNIEKDTKITTPIVLPEGIQTSDISKVTINLKVKAESSKLMKKVPVELINIPNGFNAKIIGDEYADVEVFATKNNLKKLKKEDIKVVVDLKNIDEIGDYDLPLTFISDNDLLKANIKNDKIRIKLGK